MSYTVFFLSSCAGGKNKRHLGKDLQFEITTATAVVYRYCKVLECVFRKAGQQHLNSFTKTFPLKCRSKKFNNFEFILIFPSVRPRAVFFLA